MDENCIFNLNHIEINSINHMSGFFVGNNQAMGWSSKAKQNFGLGSVENALVLDCESVVFDNDGVDMPIRTETHSLQPLRRLSEDGMKATILLKKIDVNVIGSTSAIAVGENQLNHWSSKQKTNMGNGSYSGKNISARNRNSVSDRDHFDMPVREEKCAFYHE